MSEAKIRWEDAVDDESRLVADCQDCDWHREVHGAAAIHDAMREAQEHMLAGHFIKADLE